MPMIVDIETNGIILPSVMHCACMIDITSGAVHMFANQPGYKSLEEFAAMADSADALIGHNIVSFDAPQIRRLLGAKIVPSKLIDTLHATRVLWPDLREYDRKKAQLPLKQYGSHSLYAWGIRTGVHKGSFHETTDWQSWSEEMMSYCKRDCIVTWQLHQTIVDRDH